MVEFLPKKNFGDRLFSRETNNTNMKFLLAYVMFFISFYFLISKGFYCSFKLDFFLSYSLLAQHITWTNITTTTNSKHLIVCKTLFVVYAIFICIFLLLYHRLSIENNLFVEINWLLWRAHAEVIRSTGHKYLMQILTLFFMK